DKLHALVDKIHTSPTPQRFEDPVDPACLFHMQHKEPIEPWDPVPTLVLRQQEELNAVSNIIKALNSTEGLFNQPTTPPLCQPAAPGASRPPPLQGLLQLPAPPGPPPGCSFNADTGPPPPKGPPTP
ncbi:hypothetical protein C0993_002018, partial [Termitomyces sp. T159_Od127]